MEVNCSAAWLADLHPGKVPWYPLNKRLGGPQSQPGCLGEEKNLLPLLEIKPLFISNTVQSLVSIQNMLCWLHSIAVCHEIFTVQFKVLILSTITVHGESFILMKISAHISNVSCWVLIDAYSFLYCLPRLTMTETVSSSVAPCSSVTRRRKT